MKILTSTGNEDLAIVHIARTAGGNLIEFVESLQKPKPRNEKWILTLSTLYGCPVNCKICDAGPYYLGRISKEGIFWQIEYMISKRFPNGKIPVKKLKVHFTRMGEPAFNMNVLEVIEDFDKYFNAPGFMPSVSSIAPNGSEDFFEELLRIKNEKFTSGNFQLQFSIHTTDESKRDELIPVKKWSFMKMAKYGERFHNSNERKITLSFAPTKEYPVEPVELIKHFDPQHFLIKLTPLNTTAGTINNKFRSIIDPVTGDNFEQLEDNFRNIGYDVIVSIGDFEEAVIGSTCGQNLLTRFNSVE
ncbi:MAG: radical SAM protein [Ignavibacteria bacterium]